MIPAPMTLMPAVFLIPSICYISAILLVPIVTSKPAIATVLLVPSQLMVLFVPIAFAKGAIMYAPVAIRVMMVSAVLALPIVEASFPPWTVPMPVARTMPSTPPVAPMTIGRDSHALGYVTLFCNQFPEIQKISVYTCHISDVRGWCECCVRRAANEECQHTH